MNCDSARSRQIYALIRSALLACFVFTSPVRAIEFYPVGDLPGGDFASDMRAISGDGLLIGGSSVFNTANVGFSQARAAEWSITA